MSARENYEIYMKALKGPCRKIAKVEFLNPDHSVAFALDNNERNGRSKAFIQDGTLTANLNNGKRRVAAVHLANLDGEYEYSVNKLWFGDQIRLMEGLKLPGGKDFYLPQGVFYAADPEEMLHTKKKTVTLNLGRTISMSATSSGLAIGRRTSCG